MTKHQKRAGYLGVIDSIEDQVRDLTRLEAEKFISDLRDDLDAVEKNLGDLLECEQPAEEHPSLTASQRNGGR